MDTPYVFKRCTKCGRWLVASSVNFNKGKTGKYGLRAYCKECRKKYREANKEAKAEYDKKYREQNKEAIADKKKKYREQNKESIAKHSKEYREQNKEALAERKKKYREENKEAIAEHNKKYYEENKEAILEKQKEYKEQNKERIAEYHKEYYEANKESIAERKKEYYEANKEAIAERGKKYYEENKEAIAECGKKYRQTPQGQIVAFNRHNRRRAREQNQGKGITKEQWLDMMSFFNWECAYSGKTLTKETRSIDHIEPLNKGGENEIWNCIPMNRSLNSSKQDKDMLEWYTKQPFYSHERLLKISEWQEYAKNKFLKK